MIERNKKGQFKKQFHFSDDELIDLYKEHKTLKGVALDLSVSPGFIRKEFKQRGLKYTPKIRYVCDDYFFDKQFEESYYWAGMMAADGNVSKQNDISLALAYKDIKHIEKFKTALKSDSPISVGGYNKTIIDGHEVGATAYARFRIRSHVMADNLKTNFNIVPVKTKIYSIPADVLKSPLVKHFIRGYFDGDGWYSKTYINGSGERLSLGLCGTLETMLSIRDIFSANNFGIGSLYKQKNIYKLTYSSQHSVFLISQYMYKNAICYLDRKEFIASTAKYYDDKTCILNLNYDDIVNALKTQKTIGRAAKLLGCSKSGLHKYMNKFGIKAPNARS